MKYLIKDGAIVSSKETVKRDILIENGKIIKIEEKIKDKDSIIIDAQERYIFPGFIDTHTHFDLEVSGTTTADDFSSGTKSAIAGGTTTIIDFATQNKGEALVEALENWHKKAEGKSSCNYAFHMAISDWNDNTKEQLKDMINEGVTSFKIYMTYDNMVVNDQEIYEILKETKKLGALVGVHCENGLLIKELIKEQKEWGINEPIGHSLSRPSIIEAEAVSRLLTIAKLVDSPVMIVHLTSQEALERIEYFRENGQKVLLETCPQYLLLDDSLYNREFTEASKYIISPPLRKLKDQVALWQALRDGEIQTISTDHCSFTLEQKAMGKDDFTKIPNGMPGVQERASLIYTYGVLEKIIPVEKMCELLSESPAKIYGMYPQKGSISVGSDADIVIWNPNVNRLLADLEHYSQADYIPFKDFYIEGEAEKVFLNGQLVMENGKIIKENTGVYIKRKCGIF